MRFCEGCDLKTIANLKSPTLLWSVLAKTIILFFAYKVKKIHETECTGIGKNYRDGAPSFLKLLICLLLIVHPHVVDSDITECLGA